MGESYAPIILVAVTRLPWVFKLVACTGNPTGQEPFVTKRGGDLGSVYDAAMHSVIGYSKFHVAAAVTVGQAETITLFYALRKDVHNGWTFSPANCQRMFSRGGCHQHRFCRFSFVFLLFLQNLVLNDGPLKRTVLAFAVSRQLAVVCFFLRRSWSRLTG